MQLQHDLPRTTLGRTGLEVTRLGIGGAYCKSPETYRRAIELGVTYVDTAREYHKGEDERYIGEAIKDIRERLILSSKTLKRDRQSALDDLETSLRLLQTDYLDIWHMHYVNDQETIDAIFGPDGAMEAAVKAQQQGKVRFIGVTGHIWEYVGKAVDTGAFDTVLCWYNCAMRDPETLVFPQAQKHNTGVVIMNATRQDKLLSVDNAAKDLVGDTSSPPMFEGYDLRQVPPYGGFYRYVLDHPTVNVVLRALRDYDMFEQAAQELSQGLTISSRDKAWYEAYGKRLFTADLLKL